MKHLHLITRVTLLLGMIPGLCGLAAAQDNSPAPTQSNPANKKSPPAKPKKTWTDDDVSALHSPADSYKDQKKAQNAGDAAENPGASQETAASKEPPRDKPPRLSDPKTVESADKMIAWEERDIAAQEEFVVRLKTQLETAPSEDRDHLQKLIIERQKIIADTRAERDGLVAQKKALEKKAAPAGDSVNAAAQPPQ